MSNRKNLIVRIAIKALTFRTVRLGQVLTHTSKEDGCHQRSHVVCSFLFRRLPSQRNPYTPLTLSYLAAKMLPSLSQLFRTHYSHTNTRSLAYSPDTALLRRRRSCTLQKA